ncbi:MAG: hypothetical protein ACE5E5_04320 [Phycisphaerae bacterium]
MAVLVALFGDAALFHPATVRAADFDQYTLLRTVSLPAGATVFDFLPDGRMLYLSGDELFQESAPGSGTFSMLGTLANADFPSFGPAFLRVAPDGASVAIGNNGGASFANYQVGVFDLTTLQGAWYGASHFDAAWYDATHLALTAGTFGSPSFVTLLDTTSPPASPVNPTVIDNIGGASAGVAFDPSGDLYTGNGFTGAGPSQTGWVKVFANSAWTAAIGGSPLDFEATGVLVVDVLSASSLGFDNEGNLFAGGGDFSDPSQTDFVALLRSTAVAAAAAGGGAVDTGDPALVRKLDPDAANDANFFAARYSSGSGELFVFESPATIYVYGVGSTAVPALSGWGLIVAALTFLTGGSLVFEQRRRSPRVARM